MKVSCDSEILYYVDSNGFLNEFLTKQKEIKRKFQTTQGLCLSLCVKEEKVAVSSSVGSISIVDAESFKETAWLPCHDDAEAWIVVLGPNNTMYTGGDDSTFCIWDLNSHEPIVKKRFLCGQTSGEFHPTDDNYFVQGGYDDTIRIWDRRNWVKPLSELHIGGGVWRTRFNSEGDFILVPSMYNNAKMIKNDNGILKEVWSSAIHKSITYGACWMEKRKKFATCSFYDKKFALWSYE